MNLKHLEHFLALAETGSFSRAAEQLHLTQSALSRSIQTLEADLGGPLVDRIGKRNELTPLGHTVVSRARRIAHEATELRRGVDLLLQGDGGSIRVGLGSGPGAMLMTALLKHMALNHPRVHVSISRGHIDLQLQQLRSRVLDALVIDSRSLTPGPDVLVEPVTEMRAAMVCRAGHPLAQRKTIAFKDLLDYPIASTPLSDEVARALVSAYGPPADPDLLVTLRCEDVTSLLTTVSETDAIFLGIEAAARAGLEAGTLVKLPLSPAIQIGARFAYVTLAGRTEAPVMALFRRFVAERLRD